MTDLSYLSKYITNPAIIRVIETMINQKVYCIKPEYYGYVDYRNRVVRDKPVGKEEMYTLVDVGKTFTKMPSKRISSKTLERHSRDVLEVSYELMQSAGADSIYYFIDTQSFPTLWERESVIDDLKNIWMAGAFLHDIGKALVGVDTPNNDMHAFIGANYLHLFQSEIESACKSRTYARLMFDKLLNILQWHMGFVLDKETKSYFIERKPGTMKYIETYFISIVDWVVNTSISSRRRNENRVCLQELNAIKSHMYHREYRILEEYGYLYIEYNGIKKLIM